MPLPGAGGTAGLLLARAAPGWGLHLPQSRGRLGPPVPPPVYSPVPVMGARRRRRSGLQPSRRAAEPTAPPPPRWCYLRSSSVVGPGSGRARGRVLARAGRSQPGSLVLKSPPPLCWRRWGPSCEQGAGGGAAGGPAGPAHLRALDTSRPRVGPGRGVPVLHNPLYTFLLRSCQPSTTPPGARAHLKGCLYPRLPEHCERGASPRRF